MPPSRPPRLSLNILPHVIFLCLLPALLFSAEGCNSSNQPTPAHVPTYTIFDPQGSATGAGPLGGTWPVAINNSGFVAGYFFDSSSFTHGFLRGPDGTITMIDPPNSLGGTRVTAMNNSGTLIGIYTGQDHQQHGFMRTIDGTFSDVPLPSYGTNPPLNPMPASIDDSGDIAGSFEGSDNVSHGFLDPSGGSPVVIDAPASYSQPPFLSNTYLSCITNGGSGVGSFSDSNLVSHGFLYTAAGIFRVIDAPGAQTQSIRPSGTIAEMLGGAPAVIGYTFEGNSYTSFIRALDGSYTVFNPPAISGGLGSMARYINASGVVAGNAWDSSLHGHGYLRNTDGTFTTIDVPSGTLNVVGTSIGGLNDTGGVTGSFADAQGNTHGFIRQ
jgi:hypothetical protein